MNASILGRLVFHSSDIISIEPSKRISILKQKLKINYKVYNYDKRIIFVTYHYPNIIIQHIERTGLLNNRSTELEKDRSIIEKQFTYIEWF